MRSWSTGCSPRARGRARARRCSDRACDVGLPGGLAGCPISRLALANPTLNTVKPECEPLSDLHLPRRSPRPSRHSGDGPDHRPQDGFRQTIADKASEASSYHASMQHAQVQSHSPCYAFASSEQACAARAAMKQSVGMRVQIRYERNSAFELVRRARPTKLGGNVYCIETSAHSSDVMWGIRS